MIRRLGASIAALSPFFGTPRYLIVFVHDSCWMRCRHCWFHEDWKREHLRAAPLSTGEYLEVARGLERPWFLSFTGGEAFARPDIAELVVGFVRACRARRYQIPTAGYHPEMIEAAVVRMVESLPEVPFRVDVSLDGTEEVHDEIRCRPGSWRQAVRTLRALQGLQGRYPRFDVGVITTLSDRNLGVLDAWTSQLQGLHPRGEWMLNIVRGESREPQRDPGRMAAYARAEQALAARERALPAARHRGHPTALLLSAKNSVRRSLIRGMLEGGRSGGTCQAGTVAGVLYSDGSVYPCEMLEKPLGNVREYGYDLARLWRGPAAVAARSFIRDTRCQCTQECFLSVSIPFQPGPAMRVLAKAAGLGLRRVAGRAGPGPGAPEPERGVPGGS